MIAELGGKDIKLWVEDDQLRFKAPSKDAFTTEIRNKLVANKPEIIAFLKSTVRDESSIPIASREESLPLSFAQQRLWFLNQLEGPNSTYNEPAAIRLKGPLNTDAVHAALREIQQRHEVLRTHFHQVDGLPVQVIRPDADLAMPVIDITDEAHGEEEKHRLVLEHYYRETDAPFDLEKDNLIRVVLLRLSQQEHVLILIMHHIVSDAWSVGVLVGEFVALYGAFNVGQASPLPSLPIQYADFSKWQRQWLSGKILETQINYWKKQLADAPSLLEIPTDYPRPAVQTYEGTHLAFEISKSISSQLNTFSRKEGVTVFVSMLTVFKILLFRFSGQKDIVVGSPIANRPRTELESLIGFFVNTLVLRSEISSDMSCRDLLAAVKSMTLAAYDHQDLPFEQIVDAVQPSRSMSHTPLFQVVFRLQNVPESDLSLPDLEITPIGKEGTVAKFDMIFTLSETDMGFQGAIEFNTNIFKEETMQRLVVYYHNLLEGMLENPQASIASLPMLSEPERRQVFDTWNDTQTPFPQDRMLHQLFEDQARREPNRVALIFKDHEVTYGELLARSLYLGHQLRKQGVRPNQLVAVILEKGWEQIAACLGIQFAGGAYLPIDPQWPDKRRYSVMELGEVKQVLTSDHLSQTNSWPENITHLCVDTLTRDMTDKDMPQALEPAQTGDDLAYVIFTSGSTGTPKGVAIQHDAVINTIYDINERFSVGPEDRILALSALSFDLSVYDIYGLLAVGGALVIPEEAHTQDPPHWAELIIRHRVTLWDTVPALMQILVDYMEQSSSQAETLRAAMLSGDWLPVSLPDRMRAVFKGIEIVSMGGATEASIWSIIYPIGDVNPDWKSIPYGKPLANQHFYVLNDVLEPCPIHTPGNLFIGGVGLAREYWGNETITAASFMNHPITGERLYRTGDLGRYLPDGNIEFLGRADTQVKVHGYRIELGEIEFALGQHPNVREKVVVVREDHPGVKRLVAYAVIDGNPEGDFLSELKIFLKTRLPDYMVPAQVIFLEAMPLTANGKVNRGALPAPEVSDLTSQDHVAPTTPEQKVLAEIWQDLLGLEEVGIHDNFFEVGGDSIISIQMIARARGFGYKLLPKQVFESQTIAELAGLITAMSDDEAHHGPVTGDVTLLPVQHWFFEQNLEAAHHFNQAVMLQLLQPVEASSLVDVIGAMLEHHDVLRSRFTVTQGQWNQNIVDWETESAGEHLTSVDLTSLPNDRRDQALNQAVAEAQASLDLEHGPLFRVVWFNFGPQTPGRLLLVLHHLVVDGVSWRILLEDLGTAYTQLGENKPPQLPMRTTSFQDWSEELQTRAQSEDSKKHLPFWQELKQWQVSPLPLDLEGANTVASKQSVSVTLDAEETRRLLQKASSAYNTETQDILLTALAGAVTQWTGWERVLLALESHGREPISSELDVSRTLGWFTTIFPVGLPPVRNVYPGDDLKAVKEALRRIPEHGLSYGLLRYLSNDSGIREEMEALPTPQIIFNYLGQLDRVLSGNTMFGPATESAGAMQDSSQQRAYALEIGGLVTEGALQLSCAYSANHYKAETIQGLMDKTLEALRELITHCCSEDAGGYTPSDFKDITMTQSELDEFMGSLAQNEGKHYNVEMIYPLSPLQKGLLHHSVLAPDSGVYVMQFICDLNGVMDAQTFRLAWIKVMAHHGILRTCFVDINGENPLQVVRKRVNLPWLLEDWTNLSQTEQDQKMAEELLADRVRGFDFDQAPAMRLKLVRTGPETHRFVWNYHHVIMDGWSLPLVLGDVFHAYETLRVGREPVFQPNPPYRDYIRWLNQQDQTTAGAWWRSYLQGFRKATPLGSGWRTQLEADGSELVKKKNFTLYLSDIMTEELQTYSRQSQVTLNTLIQGAWALMLYHYSGQKDIVFGNTVAGRSPELPGVEAMVGPLINTLPLRVEIRTDGSTLSWLKEIQTNQLDRDQYAYTPLATIQRYGEVGMGQPLFESLVVVDNYPVDTTGDSAPSIRIGKLESMEQTSYPLTLEVGPQQRISMRWSYDITRFNESSVKRMAAGFERLLKLMTQNPEVAPNTHAIADLKPLPTLRSISQADTPGYAERVPLSFHQERLWFIDRFEKGNVYDTSPIYHNVPLILNLDGSVQQDKLEAALNGILISHPILRTQVITEQHTGFQVCRHNAELEMEVWDLRESAPTTEEAVDLALEQTRYPFNMSEDLLMRASLLRISDTRSILLVVFHHILVDKWSVQRITRDLATAYSALVDGKEVEAPSTGLSYVDYASWQHHLTEENMEPFLFYWKRQLSGKLKALELPLNRPRPAIHTFTDARHGFSLNEAFSGQLSAFCEREGISEDVALLAGYMVMLHRYSGQDEIMAGVTDPCRNHAETSEIVGPLSNLLVLRGDASGNPDFRSFLERTRNLFEQAQAHNEMPFDRLVGVLRPEKDMSRTALFDILFQYESETIDSLEMGGITASVIHTNIGYGKYDLNLSIRKTAGCFTGNLVYNSDFFDPWLIEQMFGHFEVIMEAMVKTPELAVDDVVLLREDEIARQVHDWNDTTAQYPDSQTLHGLFAQQAATTPDQIAVDCQGRRLTYRELNERSNQLAHLLQKNSVGPDILVAICLDRSVEMIVAVMAILKAGGAYLPIEPAYPLERRQFQVEDAGTPVVITRAAYQEGLPDNVSTIIIDEENTLLEAQPITAPQARVYPDHLAYCIYTSGSTGKPKGVLLTHRNAVRLMFNNKNKFKFTQNDVWTLFHSYCFDFSVWEMYGPLLYGGKLVIVPKALTRDPAAFLDLIVSEGVTVLNQTPTAFYHLLEECVKQPRELPIKTVIFGGEALETRQLKQWRDLYPQVTLVNMYGITETTVHASYRELQEQDIRDNNRSLGGPIPTTTLYLLDENMQLSPAAIPGEIHVGGLGLARGYLGRPALTAQRFTPDALSGVSGARLYKSGDLGRFLSQGDIEYAGRIDHQVKIRGFRIELGEIESVLADFDEIRQAVVVDREDQSGNKRLIAYLTPEQKGFEIDPAALRDELKSQIPDHMIPATFMMLDRLPLTSNGKLDRAALPEPNLSDWIEKTYVAPRNPVEASLTDIWGKLLGHDRVGIHENFFEIGGDSIISIQMIARARRIGLKLSPEQIFQNQTVAELALVTEIVEDLNHDAVFGPLPLTPIQHWFFETIDRDREHHNQSVLLKVPQQLDVEAMDKAITLIMTHHDALRLRFQETPTGWLQTLNPEDESISTSLLQTFDLRETPADRRAAELNETADSIQAGFNLGEGSLLAAAWFDFGAEEPGRLLITIHHLAVDGVSWRILLEDLISAYENIRRDQPANLAPKTTSYKAWSDRLANYAASPAAQSEAAYWLGLNMSNASSLPCDNEQGENTIASIRTSNAILDKETTQALLREVPAVYRTEINDILLTALTKAYSRHAGSEDLLLTLEGHGREDLFDGVDLSRTVGWFTTRFPVYLSLDPAWSLEVGLKSIKEQLRAIPRRGIGFGLLRYLHPDPSVRAELEKRPKPQISFNYLGQVGQNVQEMNGISLADEAFGQTAALSQTRENLLDFNSLIVDGRLQVNCAYSNSIHNKQTIDGMMNEFMTCLKELIHYCRQPQRGGLTPSDVADLDISQEDLDSLVARISTEGNGRDIETAYPLSSLQSGMMYHSLISPDSGVFVIQLKARLEGDLDPTAFCMAWQDALNSFEVLRASFDNFGEEPCQVIHRKLTLPIEHLDWRDQMPKTQSGKLEKLLHEDLTKGFNFEKAPLMRIYLIRTAERTHEFVWSHHHVLLDGWSVPIVLSEVFTLYETHVKGEQSALGTSRPFRDYVRWLQTQDRQESKLFWRSYLKGFHEPTPLMSNHQAESDEHVQLKPCIINRELSEQETAGLKTLAKTFQLTQSILFQGAWALLLNRYSGERDILFGTIVSGRPGELEGVENMVGPFINNLPTRVDVNLTADLSAWLKILHKEQAQRDKFGYVPLAEIQGLSEMAGNKPLFNSILVFENYPVTQLFEKRTSSGSLRATNVSNMGLTNYPLTINIMPGHRAEIEFISDGSISERALNRLLDHYCRLLNTMVAKSDGKILDIELLTESERRHLLEAWNPQKKPSSDKCFIRLFEEQVAATPNAIAVLFEKTNAAEIRLSYSELNARANRLAHFLVDRGVGPEVTVALLDERGIDLLTAFLAVFKAGGAYLPLDPNHPPERMALILSLSKVPLLLASRRYQETSRDALKQVSGDHVPEVLFWEDLPQTSDQNLCRPVSPEHLAYVIFTSGSTGAPKGAMVEQRGMLNHMTAKIEDLAMTAADTLIQNASQCFDISVWQFLSIFLVGGRVRIVDDEAAHDPALLLDQCREATILEVVPSLLRLILDEIAQNKRPLPLRYLVPTGEALPPDLCRTWLAGHPNTPLVNAYGPTECSDDVTHHFISQPPAPEETRVPIGKAIRNMRLYILDSQLQPVLMGVVGELHVGGEGVGRGYLHNPRRTAEVFTPSLYDKQPGARLYKTGDLGRRLPDGNLDFLGRTDFQVKIRGFRLELGEIESVLMLHENVREAVVLVHELKATVKTLTAYIVPIDADNWDITPVKQFLASKLPDYMTPSTFIVLEAMPLTANGKLDRKRLPIPDLDEQIDKAYLPPRTSVETALTEIWAELLGLDRVGISDNFFEIGGDSIISIQMISRAKRKGYQCTPRQLFEHQTIAELAPNMVIVDTPQAIAQQGLVTGQLPLLPVQAEFLGQNPDDVSHYNQALLFELHGSLNSAAMDRVIEALLKHHDALRIRFEQNASGWTQRMLGWDDKPGAKYLEYVDMSIADGRRDRLNQEINRVQAGLDIVQGPIMRVVWFDYGQSPGRLLIVVHHLAMDGVSWRILLQNLQTAYEQVSAGRPIHLGEKTTSYKAWAERLESHADSDALRRELQYWKEVGNVEAGQIPMDGSGTNTYASTQALGVSLNTDETNALLSSVPEAFNTEINDVLLTALALSFRSWSGSAKTWVTLESHGREDLFDDVDLSQTLGWFTSEYPVCLMPQGEDNIAGSLKAIKEQLRSVPAGGLGYGILRFMSKDGEVAEVMNRIARPPILFNYLGRLDEVLAQEGLLRPASESPGAMVSNRQERPYLLEFVSSVSGGRFTINCTYNTQLHQKENIQGLIDAYALALREVISLCLQPDSGGATPSDFPDIALSQNELDRIYADLAEASNKRNIQMIYPLSPLQQGMMFHSLVAPDSGVYVEQIMCELQGKLELPAFRQAWIDVLDRQSIFRTLIHEVEGERSVQLVRKKVQLPWVEEDLRAVPESQWEEQVDRIVLQDRIKGYDFTKAPLMRLILIRLKDDLYRFIWSHHHVLTDGWSMPLVLQEMFAFYEAARTGTRPALPPARPFREYIRWLNRQDMDEAESFWRQYLDGFTDPTPLAVERRTGISLDQGMMPPTVTTYLDEAKTQALNDLARQGQVTFNILIQGMWSLLLHRYSGESDILFGAIVSGRPPELPGVESIVGPFINTLPVRIEIDSNEDMIPWLKSLHGIQIDRARFEYTPLVDIFRWSQVVGSAPLFETLLVVENHPVDRALEEKQQPGDLAVNHMHAVEQTNYPLTLVVIPGEQAMVQIKYDPSRFDRATVRRMLTHYTILLENLPNHARSKVSSLSIVTPEERRRVWDTWNQTDTSFPAEKMMQSLFRDQVIKTPHNTALIYADQEWDYTQLYSRAIQLANRLKKMGVSTNRLVAVCMEKGGPQVAAVYAVLFSGAAYLPVDPSWPAERRNKVLEVGEVELVITDEDRSRNESWPAGVATVCMAPSYQRLDVNEAVPVLQQPDDLAYVIFTSGSTGVPKGVMIQHQAATNTLYDINLTYSVGPQDRILALSALSFDLSVYDIFGVLATGGAVVIPDEDKVKEPAHWLKLMRRHRVTLWDTVPALMQMLIDYTEALPEEETQYLRLVMMSGDWIPTSLPDRIRSRFTQAVLISMGGATEASIWSIHYPIHEVDPSWKSIPYGRPMANQHFYVLDRYGDPCPVGVPGDLHIGGVGLALGYWADKEKTDASFFTHPQSGRRLYRTGDLGRYGEDGVIEFIGRSDFQVKVNGYRIELGEIEAALLKHPEVKKALVIVRQDQPGQRRLVAYAVLRDGATSSTQDLRAILVEKLPDYMIPSAIVPMERFPLTSNGKVNRKALPLPEVEDGVVLEHIAARTPTEEKVLEIWTDLLKRDQISMNNNFFDIGGDSILATRLISRLRKIYERELQMRVIFEAPTIAELARQLDTTTLTAESLPPLVPMPRSGAIALSYAQHRLWVFEQLEGPTSAYNVSMALRLQGSLDLNAFSKAIEGLLERHETLRTTFGEHEGVPSQIIADSAPWKLALVDLSHSQNAKDELYRFARQDGRLPFNLATGPLFRINLVKLAENDHALLVNIHHIITDGWSMGVLIRDFVMGYDAACKGIAPSLPPLPIQYADYALWQRSWLTKELMDGQLSYWREQLADLPDTNLNTDRRRPEVRSLSGATSFFTVEDEVTQSLKELSGKQGVTLYMTLLAVFKVLQGFFTQQQDIVVGADVANRNHYELNGLIGFFINQLVLRTYIGGNPTFIELQRRVQKVTIDAYSNQDLPFETLLTALKVKRDPSRTPLFQTKFVLQNAGGEAPELPSLSISELVVDQKTAKFDLLLSMQETVQGLSGIMEYSSELFEEGTIQFMLSCYKTLLAGVAQNPEVRVEELLSLLTEKEREHRKQTEEDLASSSLKKLSRIKRRRV